jgi:opacity protein-like surface antigen
MKTTYLLLPVILFFLNLNTLFSQDSLTVIGKFIQGHPWTMDFGVKSNLTLSTFQGTAISLGKFISNYQKYRMGISTNLRVNSGDQDGNSTNADTLYSLNSGDVEDENYSIQLTFQYITYTAPNGLTSIYFGIGPTIGISWFKQSSNSSSTYVSSYQSLDGRSSTSKEYSIGFLGSCGVEWFLSEHISIHAEYGLALQYYTKKGETESYNKHSSSNYIQPLSESHSNDSSSGWSLSGQNVLFGLSVNY